MRVYKRRKGGYIAYGTLEELKSLHELYDSVRIFYYHNGSQHDYSEELFAIFKSSVRLNVEKEKRELLWEKNNRFSQGQRSHFLYPHKYSSYEEDYNKRRVQMFKVSRYYEEVMLRMEE